MKKTLVYSGIIIFLICLGFYLFRYKRAFNFSKTVPENSQEYFSINLRQIEYFLIKDKLSHLFTQQNSFTSTKNKDDHFSVVWDINWPQNIVFHSPKKISSSYFSQPIEYSKPNLFHEFLINLGFINEGKSLYFWNNLYIYKTKNNFYLAFGLNNSKLISEYFNTLIHTKIYKSESNFEFVNDNTSSIFWYKKFNNKPIFGSITNKSVIINTKKYQSASPTDTISSLIQFNGDHILNSLSIIKQTFSDILTTLHYPNLEALGKHWSSATQIKFVGNKQNVNTHITTRFDDNFNTIETSIKDTIMTPNIFMELDTSNSSSVYHNDWVFLKSSNIIHFIDSQWVCSIFPLLPMYGERGDTTKINQFSTLNINKTELVTSFSKQDKDQHLFKLFINPKQFYPYLNKANIKRLDPIHSFYFEWNRLNNSVFGEIVFSKNNSEFLSRWN